MPIGRRYRGTASGPAFHGQDFTPTGLGLAGDISAPIDTWQHFVVPRASLAGYAVYTIDTPQATRIVVLELDGTKLWIGFGDDPVALIAGDPAINYDLVHPGAAELDRSVPPFTKATIMANAQPSHDVEVWTLGGKYALRST